MKHKPLARQLTAQFFRGNVPMFALAVFAALTGGTLNLIVTWLMQQLIDAASGLPGALPLGQLAWITGGFILLCAALMLLKYASEPRFIEKAMRQYKDFAFQKLTEKSISSFRAESTAAYLSALTNDAASVEADYLAQQLAVITKTVTFFGALFMMLWYSPLLTAIAVGVTALPLAASLLTGGRLQAAEKQVSERNRDFTAALSDCLSGFAVVKTFKAEREIFQLFAESNRALEQEKFSRRIAANIVKARQEKPIETTFQLVDIIKASMPQRAMRDGHPARRSFQAIRIEVNGELDVLQQALHDAFDCLNPGGRLVIITFHSLEDRMVKNAFAQWSKGCTCPKEFPVCVCGNKPKGKALKSVAPSAAELEENPRARSARLRVFEKY